MATHKLLSSGQLSDSTAVICTTASGKRWMIKTIILHNNRAGDESVEIYFDGTAEANRLLKVTLAENETFEWSLGHMIVLLDSVSGEDSLQGKADNPTEVTYHIFGAEETE